VLNLNDVTTYGLTGVISRSIGLKRDLRLSSNLSYSSYNSLTFRSFLGVNGDTFDRYLIRMLEMGESLSIINSAIMLLLSKYDSLSTLNITSTFLNNQLIQSELKTYTSMEDLITHFIN